MEYMCDTMFVKDLSDGSTPPSATTPPSDRSSLTPQPDTPLSEYNTPTSTPPLDPECERPGRKSRIIVKHSALGNRIPSHDPNVIVESPTFASVGKIQPFLISLATNAALVLDFHCHLTHSEVVGYLGGSWDLNTQILSITHAFPCKCRLGDYEAAPLVEGDIRKTMTTRGLTLVGWYHSHPTAPAMPSLRDIDTQLDNQLRMRGTSETTYIPCIGLICSPYNLENPTLESGLNGYWVVPPAENKPHEYGKPMMMSYSLTQDEWLSHDTLLELKKCADFYKPEQDFVTFVDILRSDVTYLEKLKGSLLSKLPRNLAEGEALWRYIDDILTPGRGKAEMDILRQIIGISSAPRNSPPPELMFNFPSLVQTPTPKVSRSRGSNRRTRDTRGLANLSNYFVGSDLASALFGNSYNHLDPATKSLLNLNSLSMFLPPMAGLMKPPLPPSYFSYGSPTRSPTSSSSSTSSTSSSRSRNSRHNQPSTSRDMPPPNKMPKLDLQQMANLFFPAGFGKGYSSRPSSSDK